MNKLNIHVFLFENRFVLTLKKQQERNPRYFPRSNLVNGLKGTIMNQTYPSVNGGSPFILKYFQSL